MGDREWTSSTGRPDASVCRRRAAGRHALRVGVRILLIVALGVGALALRREGLDWPPLHPDGRKIDRWIRLTLHHAWMTDQVYPGGFFTLLRPFHAVAAARKYDRMRTDAIAAGAPMPTRADAERKVNVIKLAQEFNAWMGAATCWLLLALVWRMTGHFPSAFFAGVLAACHPFHIEHGHYAETDVAMVFTLTAALLLWAMVHARPGWVVFGAACLVSGFAAGTKYTLLLLMGLVPLFALAPGGERRTAGRKGLLLAVGLLLFGAGFLWANPAVLDPAWFIPRLGQEAAGVFDETRGVIGEAAGRPWARLLHQTRGLIRFIGAQGPVGLTVTGIGLVALVRRPWRAWWRVTLVFPALYAAYLLGKAPWIRMQETLVLMPLSALAAGAAFQMLQGDPQARRARVRGVCVGALAVLAGAAELRQGLMRTSLFTPRDTRHFAEEWLQRHLPRGRAVGLEVYTKSRPGHPVPVREIVPLYKIEHAGIASARTRGAQYLLRNASMMGRGSIDPFTGRPYATYERQWNEFLAGSTRLAAWSPAPPPDAVTFAFVNSSLELYGFDAPVPRMRLDLPLERPVVFTEAQQAVRFPLGAELGAEVGVELGESSRTWLIGGPRLPDDLFVMLYSPAGTTVRITGRGRRRRVSLAAGEACVVPLRRPFWAPRVKGFDTLRLAATTASNDIPCLAQVTFDAVDAALWLRRHGHSEPALEMVRQAGAEDARARLARRLIAGSSTAGPGDQPLLDTLAEAGNRPDEDLSVNGVSGYFYNEMARVYLSARDGEIVTPLSPPVSGEARAELAFPVELPAGRWRVRGQIRPSAPRDGGPASASLRILDPAGRLLQTLSFDAETLDGWREMDVTLDLSVAQRLTLVFIGPSGGCVRVRNPEIYWTLKDRLSALRTALGGA